VLGCDGRAFESLIRKHERRAVLDTTGRMPKIMGDAEPFEAPLSVSARLYTRIETVLAEE
jgi:hypothetical protein